MVLSFIIPSIGRVNEVSLVLKSILDNTPKKYSYEVLVIDQNGDDRLDSIVESYKSDMDITSYKVSFRAAGKARNYGIMRAKGDFLNFPDDDCIILDGSVGHAVDFLVNNSYALVSGKSVDEQGKNSMINFPEKPSEFNLKNFGYIIEYSFFVKRSVMLNYLFDDTLGPGCFHGADECFDLIYRMLKQGEKLYYEPKIKFYHPQAVMDHSLPKTILRSFTYRCGFAKSSLKHGLYWRLFKRLFLVIVYLPYCMIFEKKKVRFYLAEILGIFSGMVIK